MPSSCIRTFTDPIPYQAAVRTAQLEILVTTRGEFRSELTKIDLRRLWLQSGRESLPHISHVHVSAKRAGLFFLVGTDQPAIRHSRTDLSPGEIMVYGSNATHHHRTSAPCHWGAISMTPADLAAAGRVVTGCELAVPTATHPLRPNPSLMLRLLNLHEAARRLADVSSDILERPEVTRALDQALVYATITCLAEGMPVESRSAGCHHSRVIARFEELLAENHARPMYVAEICAGTGVSERTLRACCHEHLGMGPIRYLWLRRMHLARRALMLADSTTTTVTEIATESGFWELGRFSVAYRTLFGESPSATLRRPVDDRSETARQADPFALAASELHSAPAVIRAITRSIAAVERGSRSAVSSRSGKSKHHGMREPADPSVPVRPNIGAACLTTQPRG